MRHTLLAIDDVSLPWRKNTCLYLGKPTVRPQPVLTPSPVDSGAPDDLAANFYGTVLHDGGRFRMWYYACHRGTNPDWPPAKKQQIAKQPDWLIGARDGHEFFQGPLCYAESDDGILWHKPALGQVLFKGSRANNALDLPHTLVSGAAVIRDAADPDPARRYKMIYQFFPDQTEPPIAANGALPSIACAVSPDGLDWTVTALPFTNQFVEHCSFIRHNNQYIVHSQAFPGTEWSAAYTEGGAAGGRSGTARASYDFDRWPDLWQWAFALPESADPGGRGADKPYDQVHLGVGAASFGTVCVGIYGLWHSQAMGEKRQRSWQDVEECVGYLIRHGYTHPSLLFICSHSAGAITAWNAIHRKPHLYKGTILRFPFLDVLSNLLDPSQPLSNSDYNEFGNPVSSKKAYQEIQTFSPYENISTK